MVTEVETGGRLHYEMTLPDDRHHRMVRQIHRGAFNLSPCYLPEFREILVREFGFIPGLGCFSKAGVYVGRQELGMGR